IRQAALTVKTLGKFTKSSPFTWEPVCYPGYTLITPTFPNDTDNLDSYFTIIKIKGELSEELGVSKYVEAPSSALHMTVARLISGNSFRENLEGVRENEFIEAVKALSKCNKVNGGLKFEIKGVTVFPSGVVAALISTSYEDDYNSLQSFRDIIYNDTTLGRFGVERKRRFSGHITLFYVEDDLENEEKEKLIDAVTETNSKYFKKPVPFTIKRAELRRFNNFMEFHWDESMPFLEL
ncbi:MAG TPA: hypothetical protein VF941_08495, partial [Clostridia bacterium]